MWCIKPRVTAESTVPCGNCRFCRKLAQKVWGTRILLESYFHPYSTFGTLTYNDDTVPSFDGLQVLWKPDILEFTEKMRYRTQHIKPLRYFIVGEYGEQTWRPHYHFIFFGLDVFQTEHALKKAWPKGFHQVAELNFDRALYTAQYCLKKMTKPDDEKLMGRMPEFSRMSKGIGLPAVGWLADGMGKKFINERGEYGPALKMQGDVFNTVRIEGRVMPLGRYMRRKLREALGLADDPRERAIQLGRFDHSTGEIFEDNVPREYHPVADISDIRSPWRNHVEKAQHQARAEKAAAADARASRQSELFRSARL